MQHTYESDGETWVVAVRPLGWLVDQWWSQRFTGRAGSAVPGRVRRALDGAVDTDRRVNGSMTVDKEGRLGTKLARSGGLKMGPDGLELDPIAVGDKNLAPIDGIAELNTGTATAAVVAAAFNSLLSELRRTKRMRG